MNRKKPTESERTGRWGSGRGQGEGRRRGGRGPTTVWSPEGAPSRGRRARPACRGACPRTGHSRAGRVRPAASPMWALTWTTRRGPRRLLPRARHDGRCRLRGTTSSARRGTSNWATRGRHRLPALRVGTNDPGGMMRGAQWKWVELVCALSTGGVAASGLCRRAGVPCCVRGDRALRCARCRLREPRMLRW